jgi:hypothetical protein
MRKTLLIYFSKKILVDDQEVAPAIRAFFNSLSPRVPRISDLRVENELAEPALNASATMIE